MIEVFIAVLTALEYSYFYSICAKKNLQGYTAQSTNTNLTRLFCAHPTSRELASYIKIYEMAFSVEPSPLPSLKRFITTNNESGKAVLSNEIPRSATWTSAGTTANFFLGYCTTSFPADLSSSADIETYKSFLSSPPGLVVHGGSVLRIVDIAPGEISPMHRTTSLDYGVVLEGNVELVLDGGEKVVLHRGDTCVQRATNHAWRNTSETEWARMLYVLIEAKPPIVDGKVLGEDLGGMENVKKSE